MIIRSDVCEGVLLARMFWLCGRVSVDRFVRETFCVPQVCYLQEVQGCVG